MTLLTSERTQWILTIGFHQNIVSNFKAWIMYYDTLKYGPQGQRSISYPDLAILKKEHNYELLKRSKEAPWHDFLHILQNTLPTQANNSSSSDEEESTDYLYWKNKWIQSEIENKKLDKKYKRSLQQIDDTTLYIHKYQTLAIKYNNLIQQYKQAQQEINNTRLYIQNVYRNTIKLEKTIKMLTEENNSFKEGFTGLDDSGISQQTRTLLTDKYSSIETKYDSILCPITQDIMIEPVIAFDGCTYEKDAILTWFKNNNKSPSTGTTLTNRLVIANHSMRKLIEEITTT